MQSVICKLQLDFSSNGEFRSDTTPVHIVLRLTYHKNKVRRWISCHCDMNYPMIPPSMKAPPIYRLPLDGNPQTSCGKGKWVGQKICQGVVAFIQNGHGFANVPRQTLSLLCHYLHKRHDYFVTCCFHAICDLQTATQFFLEWGISIGYNSCTYRSQTHLSQK